MEQNPNKLQQAKETIIEYNRIQKDLSAKKKLKESQSQIIQITTDLVIIFVREENDYKNQGNKLRKSISELHEQELDIPSFSVPKSKTSLQDLEAQLHVIESKRLGREQKIVELNQRIEVLKGDNLKLENEIQALEEKKNTMQTQYDYAKLAVELESQVIYIFFFF